MAHEDERWQQRFQNFEKTLLFLEESIAINAPSIFEQAGLIQFFEISFELSWNVMKEYMEAQGITDLRSPRDSIKKAFEMGLINDGHLWIQALENRNLTLHTYDEARTKKIVSIIEQTYIHILRDLYNKLKTKK